MSDNDHSVGLAGPKFHIDLAALDARHPVHYSRRLLLFRCTSSTQRDNQIRALKAGVQALLRRCPILGGKVVPLPPEQARNGNEDWRTLVPSEEGLELILKDLTSSLSSFELLEKNEFPPSQLPYDLLVPVPQDIGNDKPSAACKIQYTAIEGGAIVTFAMTHCVADGAGNNELFRILSEEARLAQQADTKTNSEPQEAVGLDRSLLRNIQSDTAFDIEQHPAFMWASEQANPPASVQSLRATFKATASEPSVLLSISPRKLAQLKSEATPSDIPFISTHDALAALVWRSVLLIRSRRAAVPQDMPGSTIGQFYMPSDARRSLGLPASYIGNAVYQLAAELDLNTLFAADGLQHAASAIRRAITAVKPELVASYMAQIRDKWVDWKFLTTYDTTGVAMGTDWTSDVVYGDDWGSEFGPVVKYRYPGEPANCIMPKRPDGGAEVYVSVMPDEVEILRGPECFGKYLE